MNVDLFNAAVMMLGREYDRACKSPEVRNPIAYALYKTWKQFDSKAIEVKKDGKGK